MPELPEVELTMRILRPRIAGRHLIGFWTDWPRGLKSSIPSKKISCEIEGLKIKGLSRRGKALFINFDSPAGLSFVVHLRMSGALLFGRPKILVSHTQKKYVHFIWQFSDGNELWFRDPRKLGVVWYGTAEELNKDSYISSLGPDALSVPLIEFRDKIKQHHGQLKPLFLRQDVIAGLGNITVDESLWAAKLHPAVLTQELSDKDIKRLYIYMQKTLNSVIKAEGNTMRDWILPDGRAGRAILKWKVYGREGAPCFRCGTKIKKTFFCGRGTHFCPKCQKIN